MSCHAFVCIRVMLVVICVVFILAWRFGQALSLVCLRHHLDYQQPILLGTPPYTTTTITNIAVLATASNNN
jgi:HAMP domain-containing protein